jgi:hypothetical protein
MKEPRPYRATRAELRAIDEALREKKPAPGRLVRAALRRFRAKRRVVIKPGASAT